VLSTPSPPLTWPEVANRCYENVRNRHHVLYELPAYRGRGGGYIGKDACDQYVEDMRAQDLRLVRVVMPPAREPAPLPPLPSLQESTGQERAPREPVPGEAVPAPHQIPGPVPGFSPYRLRSP
jgi:hypothetical protein